MVDHTPVHSRKVGGVRFSADTDESSNEHEEHPLRTNELLWEQCYNHDRSFSLYFGILKLSHIYTMTMDVVFQRSPVKLEPIVDQQVIDGYELSVTEKISKIQTMNRTSFEVEIVINPDSIPGPFHRTFFLRQKSISEQEPIRVNVTGKILRQGQGTATLRDGVHMKSIIIEKKDDE